MRPFPLAPVAAGDFDPTDPHYACFTLRIPMSSTGVWAALHAPRPLAWCRGIRAARWTTPAPHGVHSTREVTLRAGVRLNERYFLWDESPAPVEGRSRSHRSAAGDGPTYTNAFTVESATVPTSRRFGERSTVIADGHGAVLTWEFLIEPRVPDVLAPAARRRVRADLDRIRRDTEEHFAGADGALP